MAANPDLEQWAPILDQYCLSLAEAGKKPTTVRNYRHDIETLIRWQSASGSQPFSLEEFGTLQLQRYRAFLAERFCSATANRRMSSVRSVLRWLEQRGNLEPTPRAENLRNFREAPRRGAGPQPLGQSEIDRLVSAVQYGCVPRDIAILTLLLNTGIRISELIELKWTDIMIRKKIVSIRITTSEPTNHRVIPLNDTARRALLALSRKESDRQNGTVFVGREGEMSRRAVEMMLKRYARVAGIKRFTPIRLRHAFFTSLIGAGLDAPIIAMMTGHKSLRATLQYYDRTTGVDMVRLRQALKVIQFG